MPARKVYNNDDLSDVRPDSGVNGNVSPQQLPIRGEKRIIGSPVSPVDVSNVFRNFVPKDLQKSGLGFTDVEEQDFNIHAALSPYTDYVIIRLFNRGLAGNGNADGTPAVYRFLINPSQVVVNRTTLDAQAMARSGWQIGVWGEDSLSISLTGKTAGQYFAFGTTDRYEPFTESYRNLEQLQVVFENNGYWFEGEQSAEGPLGGGADFTRRIIKMHSDVELSVGNFIWYGMFESLTISQNAETPFLMDFQLNFVAWKERFRRSAPYKDTIHNDIKRGHDFGTWKASNIDAQQATSTIGASQVISLPPNTQTAPQTFDKNIPPKPVFPVSPAVQSALASNFYPSCSPTATDTEVPIGPAINPFAPTINGTWRGILSPLQIGDGGKDT